MNYEILYIIPAKYSDTEIEEINKKILPILEEAGASIIKIDNWGKKKLAYQIKHFRYGYYTLIIFSAPAEALAKITEKLNLNQEIIRFQIVKEIKDFGLKPRAPKKDKEEKSKEEEKVIEPASAEASTSAEATADKTADNLADKEEEKKEEVTKEEEKEEESKKKKEKITAKAGQEKASIDELDKKLDELLSDAV